MTVIKVTRAVGDVFKQQQGRPGVTEESRGLRWQAGFPAASCNKLLATPFSLLSLVEVRAPETLGPTSAASQPSMNPEKMNKGEGKDFLFFMATLFPYCYCQEATERPLRLSQVREACGTEDMNDRRTREFLLTYKPQSTKYEYIHTTETVLGHSKLS